MSISDKVLDAIQLMTKSAVEKANYNRTIEALVVSCQDSSLGKYKCKYQDTIFIAYSDNIETKYSKNTSVYVLIPDNNMSKDRIILGSVKKLGENYITQFSEQDAYEVIGINCFEPTDEDDDYTVDTNAFNDNVYKDSKIISGSNLTNIVNIESLNQYIKNQETTNLILGATIRTDLSEDHQQKGYYGLKFTLNFNDNNNGTVQRTYILDNTDMVGNPYQFKSATRQFKIFDIDGINFDSIESIELFCNNFPEITNDSQEQENEEIAAVEDLYPPSDLIYFSNFELYAAKPKTQQELNGVNIELVIPQGTYFSINETETKTITAQLKEKNQLIESSSIKYFWASEDAMIDTNSQYYNRLLGNGWKWQNVESTESAMFTIEKESCPNQQNRFKVAVLYNDSVYTKTFIIYNTDGNIQITIVSDQGTQFYYDSGNPTLTCVVKINDVISDTNNYNFKWLQKLSPQSNFEAIGTNNNQLSVNINQITAAGQFKCSVYNKSNNIYRGTAAITLTNSLKTEGSYSLVLQNGDTVFQYDADGLLLNDFSMERKLPIPALTFQLFNSAGQQVTQNVTDITWRVSKENSLLNISGGTEVGEYKEYYSNSLPIAVENRFNIYKNKNQVQLIIKYAGNTLTTVTHFTFVKEGDPGTNGTGYLLKVVPNTSKNSVPDYPTITYSNSKFYLNYGINNSNDETEITSGTNISTWFTPQLWKDGISTTPSVIWDILKRFNSEGSSFTSSSGTVTFTETSSNLSDLKKFNILKCSTTQNSKTYYTAIPICLATTTSGNRLYVKNGTGFKYVVYESDGTHPHYDNSIPFEIVNQNNQSVTISSISVEGGLTASIVDNKIIATPVENYLGDKLNNGILVTSGSNQIFIPIYFSLNKYGFSNLNEWDGNSVRINNDSYILAPQIGAGIKENDNTFSGVLMGKLKTSTGSSQLGLFGFSKGQQTFNLNSETGKLTLGGTQGQIIIDPSNSNHLIIQSSTFSTGANGQGLKIDLSAPSIMYGNGNFSVDSSGNLTAKNVSLIGSITATSGKIGGWTINDNYLSSSNGVYIDGSTGAIYSSNHSSWGSSANGFYLNTSSGMSFGSNFSVTNTGVITATSGQIGGWNITADSIYATNTQNGYSTQTLLNSNGIIQLKASSSVQLQFNSVGVRPTYSWEEPNPPEAGAFIVYNGNRFLSIQTNDNYQSIYIDAYGRVYVMGTLYIGNPSDLKIKSYGQTYSDWLANKYNLSEEDPEPPI